MRHFNNLTLVAVALLATSCFKKVEWETAYIIKPMSQSASDDRNPQLVEGAFAYAFEADTALWEVRSYEDAVAGLLTAKEGTATCEAYAVSEPYAPVTEGEAEAGNTDATPTGWLNLHIDKRSQIVLVVDPVHRHYAYTQQPLEANLNNLYVSVVFQPWKASTTYQANSWYFFNPYYTPPRVVTCAFAPKREVEEGAAPAEIESLRIFGYGVDTTAWHVASYEDAVAAAITSKQDSTLRRTTPEYTAYRSSTSGLYTMEVSAERLMLVVVDRTDQIYAYTEVAIDLDGEGVTYDLCFRPWQKYWKRTEGAWVMVDSHYNPDTPEASPAASHPRATKTE